jgi:hypothetical protein
MSQAEKEVVKVLKDNSEDIWGIFWNHKDKAIFVGSESSPEKRQSIVEALPSLSVVFFLAGLSKATYKQNPNLLQSVLMYGGTLDAWRWALGAGEWRSHYIECTGGKDVLGITQTIVI